MTDEIIIALDVGGSSIKSGAVRANLQVENMLKTPVDSQGDAETILGTFTGVIQDYLDYYQHVRGVGVGFPSPFDYDNGICLIQGVQKYESIYGINMLEAFRGGVKRPDLPILFRNDAEAAIVGEAIYGAGKAYSRFIGLTLGTGMGSSFIVDGQRVESGNGVPEGGFLFPELFRGVQADEWFSTRGLLARFEAIDMPFDDIADAATLARRGDDDLIDVFEQFGADMAEFLLPYLAEFEAEALIVLGGIAHCFDLFGDVLREHLPVPVEEGKLEGRAALLGAADLFLR